MKKNPAANLSAGQGHPEQPRKDAAMTDSAPATAINEAPLKVATPPQAAMTAVPAKTEAATLPESTAPASSNVMSTGTGELIPAETQSQPIVGSQPLGAQVSAEPQPTSQPDPNSTSPPNAPAPATVVPTPNPAPVQ